MTGVPERQRRASLAQLSDGQRPVSLLLRALDVTLMPAWTFGRDRVVSVMERRAGIRTAGIVSAQELGIAHPERVDYDPVPWFALRRALPVEWVRPYDVFVDLGSGMGRAVFQAAAYYPFRRVVGVELSPRLTEVAQANIERNRARLRCQDVQFVTGDVRDYEIPDDVTVAFLYNPFHGQTFATVVDHLLASVDRNPRSLRIVYVSPREHDRLMATGRVRLARRLRRPRPVKEWAEHATTHLYDVVPAGVRGEARP